MNPQILAIDNGTQSLRAIIYDVEGGLIAKARVPFTPYLSPKPGWAEQDPSVYWGALVEACQQLWTQQEVRPDALIAVCVTTQRGTVLNLDKNGEPLRPAITWLDNRQAFDQKPIGGHWGLLFRIAGLRHTVAQLQANAESNWIREHQPEIWNKTHKFTLLSGYLNFKLTGRFADSVGSTVGYLPFDYKKLTWAKASDWKWQALEIDHQLLTELIHPGEQLGQITASASAATGIPKGLPVIAGAADKACEVLGAGSLSPDIGCISYGTTATITTINPKYTEVVPFIPPYPAAVPFAYAPEFQIFRGYWMIEWFKHEFGHQERDRAESMDGVEAEHLLEELIRDIPPGSAGLLLQPYWTPGVKVPGPEARGAVIGFTDEHTRGHLYRAILEGIAYALREGGERMQKRARQPFSALRVSGGGSQCDTALQITADVFNLPASRPHVYETSALGAAIIAAVGMGVHADFATAVRHMTHLGDTFKPVEANRALYEDLYHQVYKKMYRRLKPLYQTLRRLKRAGDSG